MSLTRSSGRISAWTVLPAVLVAALVAGLALSAFHLTVSERYVERAITREAALHPDEDHGQEVFSRQTQKVGLVAGTLVYALAVGLLFGGAYTLAGERLPGATRRRRALILAGASLWALFVAPFLKYAPNPPGAGDPNTIYQRQALYVGFLALTIAGLLGARWLAGALSERGLRRLQVTVLTLGAYAAYFALLFFVLPGNPDHNDVPATLLWQFRAVSLAGTLLFWALFGVLFATRIRSDER